MATKIPRIDRNLWPVKEWMLSKSNSSYGTWALRIGVADIKFFWSKAKAQEFINQARKIIATSLSSPLRRE